MINGNTIGIGSTPLKTVILEDENGNSVTGVVTGSEMVFTATDDDVRVGSVYVGDQGVSTGTKIIPAYHTTEGYEVIPAGSVCAIVLSDYDAYDYTKFQALVCEFNSSVANSVSTIKVVIENNVYNTNSTNAIAAVNKNSTNKTVDLKITNDGSKPYVIRYFTYKEI